jgi:solute carrier family 50 protein (sugar transporter)
MTAIEHAAISSILSLLGPILFMSVQLSSIYIARSIKRARSTGTLSPMQFISLSLNCSIWLLYGVLMSDFTVIIPNMTGTITGGYCIFIYNKYTHSRPYLALLTLLGILILSIILFILQMEDALGFMGIISSILLMGSPMSTLAVVYREQSTASMPFLTSFTLWLNSISWFLFGIFVAHDSMVCYVYYSF